MAQLLGQFRIFKNRPLDPVLSPRVISEKQMFEKKQKFEKLSKE